VEQEQGAADLEGVQVEGYCAEVFGEGLDAKRGGQTSQVKIESAAAGR